VSVIYVQDDISETITISAQDENAKVGTSADIYIGPADVDYFVVSVVSPQTAGAGFTGTVAGYDQFNNLVAGDSTTAVTLTDTGSADFYTTASYGTGTTETYTLTSGEATIYVRDFVAETIQITAESDNGSIGTSADIWVRPAVINYYAVSASTPQTAGVGFTGTVEAYDVYNNLVFTDSSTVMTMTNTGAAAFYTSGSYAVTTETYMLSSGTAVLFVKDNTAETIQITAESDNGSIGTSANVVIGTNVIDYFTISAGTAQVAGVGFPGTVEAYDAYDNFVASDSTTVVTMTDSGSAGFYTSGSYGTPTDNYTLSGGATAIYVKDETAETTTLFAASGNGSVGTSAAITVEPASVNHYTFTVGTNQTAGTGFTGTAQGWDTYNNLVTNDSASVITMTNTGSADFYTNGTYGATTTYYTLSSGEAVIFVQDDISETLTLSAEDGPGDPAGLGLPGQPDDIRLHHGRHRDRHRLRRLLRQPELRHGYDHHLHALFGRSGHLRQGLRR